MIREHPRGFENIREPTSRQEQCLQNFLTCKAFAACIAHSIRVLSLCARTAVVTVLHLHKIYTARFHNRHTHAITMNGQEYAQIA